MLPFDSRKSLIRKSLQDDGKQPHERISPAQLHQVFTRLQSVVLASNPELSRAEIFFKSFPAADDDQTDSSCTTENSNCTTENSNCTTEDSNCTTKNSNCTTEDSNCTTENSNCTTENFLNAVFVTNC